MGLGAGLLFLLLTVSSVAHQSPTSCEKLLQKCHQEIGRVFPHSRAGLPLAPCFVYLPPMLQYTVSLVSPAHIWGGVRLGILSDYLTRRLMGTVFGVTASLFYLAGGGNIQAGRMDGFLTHEVT